MNYRIRPLVTEDEPFLWEMLYHAIYIPDGEERPERGILKRPEIAKYLEDWGRDGDHALVAIDEQGMPVGAIWIRRFTESSHGYGYIDEQTPELSMAIVPGYRGRGLGGELLWRMSETARSHGYNALSLSVDPRNEAAVRLYQRHGFENTVQDAGGSWTMVKQLDESRSGALPG